MPDFVDADAVHECAFCGKVTEYGTWCRCPRCAYDHYICRGCVHERTWSEGDFRLVKICPRLSTLEEKVALELSGIYPYGPRD